MQLFNWVWNRWSSSPNGTATAYNSTTAQYDLLERCYLNADVYDSLAFLALEGAERTDLKPLRSLRNPANRVVEFYASKLRVDHWLENIQWEAKAEANADAKELALLEIDVASNWMSEGRVSTRQYAWAGDLILKASHKERNGEALSVYRERIDPRYVTEFDKDERGFFTYLRTDIPKTRRLEDGDTESYTQTDIWDKTEKTYQRFERTTEALTEPVLDMDLDTASHGAPDGFTGYDFIPVVHIKFRDVGGERGLSAFGHALSAIREADTIATRLHEMLFPEEVVVLERQGVGPDGEPLPPIQLENDGTQPLLETGTISDGKGWARGYPRTPATLQDNTVRVGQKRMVALPSGGKLAYLVPDRNLSALSEVLAEQVKELEHQLPETAYSKLRELELSGRALRYVLMDVIDRYEEVFANLSQGIVRLNGMLLTLGQVLELKGFSPAEIGTFADGSFEHSFEMDEPLPSTPFDDAEAQRTEAEALAAWKSLGSEPYRRALVEAGWSKQDALKESGNAQAPQLAAESIQGAQDLVERALSGQASDAPRGFVRVARGQTPVP